MLHTMDTQKLRNRAELYLDPLNSTTRNYETVKCRDGWIYNRTMFPNTVVMEVRLRFDGMLSKLSSIRSSLFFHLLVGFGVWQEFLSGIVACAIRCWRSDWELLVRLFAGLLGPPTQLLCVSLFGNHCVRIELNDMEFYVVVNFPRCRWFHSSSYFGQSIRIGWIFIWNFA